MAQSKLFTVFNCQFNKSSNHFKIFDQMNKSMDEKDAHFKVLAFLLYLKNLILT